MRAFLVVLVLGCEAPREDACLDPAETRLRAETRTSDCYPDIRDARLNCESMLSSSRTGCTTSEIRACGNGYTKTSFLSYDPDSPGGSVVVLDQASGCRVVYDIVAIE